MASIKTLELPSGQPIPVLGQGTAGIAKNSKLKAEEVRALIIGLDLGMSLIDTAETYSDGRSEKLIAEVINGRRKEAFLVSKVLPQNATKEGTIEACENSLRRLGTDYLDLYLLHWPGSVPLTETLEAFQFLKQSGKILDYGVSNFDQNDMEKAYALPGGEEIASNQLLYNLSRRGIEWDVLPWCTQHKIPIMAYSPFEQGRLLKNSVLKKMAAELAVTSAQIALAWLLHQKGVVVIPKASNVTHVKENFVALNLILTSENLKELDQAFPPPNSKVPLETI